MRIVRLWRAVALGGAALLLGDCGAGCVGACTNGTVTPPIATVHGVTVSPSNPSVTVGNTVVLFATVAADAGVDLSVDWSSADPTIASVSGGAVLGVGVGTTTILARSRANASISGSAVVTVTGTVKSITVTPATTTIPIGTVVAYTANVSADAGVATTVVWTSSNPGVAPVTAAGVVSGAALGSAIITATSTAVPSKAASFTVTVTGRVNSVTVTPSTGSVLVGGTTAFSAIVSADVGVATSVTWSSTNPATATVSAAGIVTGVAGGVVTIIATSTVDPTKQGSAVVTVVDPCAAKNYTPGIAVNGTVTGSSCRIAYSGQTALTDVYTYTTAAATTLINFQVTSGVVPTWLAPARITGLGYYYNNTVTPASVSLYAFVKAGTYFLDAGSADSTKSGAYTLSSAVNPTPPNACTYFITTTGITASLNLTAANCLYAPQSLAGTYYATPFQVEASVGTALTVRVVAVGFNPLIEIRDNGTNAVLASSSPQTLGTVTASFTTTATNQFVTVWVTSRTALQTGSYTITITP